MSLKQYIKSGLESKSGFSGWIFKQIYSLFLFYNQSRILFFFKFKPYMDDKKYINKLYKKRFNKRCNLTSPQTFNEKINWRKLYDRKNEYTSMVDKYKVKEIIKEKCGEQYRIPLLEVWDKPQDINFDMLPTKFVLKANHAGGVIICRDKTIFNKKKAISELSHSLKDNYYLRSREWPYKDIERKIICEKYVGENLTEYKNYCFNGKLQFTFVWKNKSRADGRKPKPYFCGAYDREWHKTNIEIDYPSIDEVSEKPNCYNELVAVAEKMSKSIPFVRVDCYMIDNQVYVGEMTFFPWGGFMRFKDEKWDQVLGEMMILPINPTFGSNDSLNYE